MASRVKQHRAIHSNPHQLQEAGVGKYLIILAPFAAGTGIVAYAKYVKFWPFHTENANGFPIKFVDCFFLFFFSSDKEFRKSLVDTVPLADPLLKIFLQEEGNAVSEASKSIQGATQKVIGVKDSIVGYFGDEKLSKSAEKTIEKSTPLKSNINFICFIF